MLWREIAGKIDDLDGSDGAPSMLCYHLLSPIRNFAEPDLPGSVIIGVLCPYMRRLIPAAKYYRVSRHRKP
jgi:hypothetical protein